jgi:hypothetical protein
MHYYPNLFCYKTLYVSGNFSPHHQVAKTCMKLSSAECTVKTPDDGHRRCPKHKEFYSRINLDNSAYGWVFKKKYITMHGNMNVM